MFSVIIKAAIEGDDNKIKKNDIEIHENLAEGRERERVRALRGENRETEKSSCFFFFSQ